MEDRRALRSVGPLCTHWRPRLLPLAWVLLLWAQPASAQNVTEPALKSLLIHNLARYTVWPADALPPQAPFLAACLATGTSAELRSKVGTSRCLTAR